MSLAAIEDLRPDTLYVSTGGGWSPATDEAIRSLAKRANVRLVAATDNNRQGDVYADRVRAIAAEASAGYARSRPRAGDWNEDLRRPVRDWRKSRSRKTGEQAVAACPASASRGSCARVPRPLTRRTGERGRPRVFATPNGKGQPCLYSRSRQPIACRSIVTRPMRPRALTRPAALPSTTTIGLTRNATTSSPVKPM